MATGASPRQSSGRSVRALSAVEACSKCLNELSPSSLLSCPSTRGIEAISRTHALPPAAVDRGREGNAVAGQSLRTSRGLDRTPRLFTGMCPHYLSKRTPPKVSYRMICDASGWSETDRRQPTSSPLASVASSLRLVVEALIDRIPETSFREEGAGLTTRE